MKKLFSHNILSWYKKSARSLPWRNTGDPYKTWISEIIMQQTRVEQGTPYYIRFVEKFPDILSLSKSSEDELLSVWQGLGYYSRALNLKKSAQIIMEKHHGKFPKTYAEILSLKGIGPYTAGAISSICFNIPVPAIDGNAKRVVSRYLGLTQNVDKQLGIKTIEKFLKSEIPDKKPGEFNQALMELGSQVCTPKSFKCELCPLNDSCVSYSQNLQDEIPVRNTKKKPTNVFLNYLVLHGPKGYLCYKRDLSSIWKGLYEFANIDSRTVLSSPPRWSDELPFLKKEDLILSKTLNLKHQLSHRTIFAKFWVYQSLETNIVVEKKYQWISQENLIKKGIPQLMKKYLDKQN